MVWAALGSNRGATGWLRAEHSRTAPTTAPETARFGVAITDSVTEGSNAKKTPATVHPKNPVIPAITKLCRMDTGTAGRVGRHRCLAGRSGPSSVHTDARVKITSTDITTKGTVVGSSEERRGGREWG